MLRERNPGSPGQGAGALQRCDLPVCSRQRPVIRDVQMYGVLWPSSSHPLSLRGLAFLEGRACFDDHQ